MAAIDATPTSKHPSHHISLTDGTNTIGLIAVDGKGDPSLSSIRREPVPKSTLFVKNQGGQLSEMQAPYGEVERSTWIGGCGIENADDDSSGYWWGDGIWAEADNKLLLAPRLWLSWLPTTEYYNQPRPRDNSTAWHRMTTTAEHYAFSVTPSADFVCDGLQLRLRVTGAPTNLIVGLYPDDSGKPGASTIHSSLIPLKSGVHNVTCFIGHTLTGGVKYWFDFWVLDGEADTSYVEILCKTSATYTGYEKQIPNYVAHVDGAPCFALLNDDLGGKFFEYKGALMYVTRPQRPTASRLFLNGDRGAADSNVADKTKLIDATKSGVWVADQWIGAIARITGGPGRGEWRIITDNDTTSLTLNRAWTATHTTDTEYAIVGSPFWQEIGSTGLSTVTDVCVSNQDVIYFAHGAPESGVTPPVIKRARFYNNSGTWTPQFADDTGRASLLYLDYDSTDKVVIWRALNGNTAPSIARSTVKAWGTDLNFGAPEEIGSSQPIQGLINIGDGYLAILKTDSIWKYKAGVANKLSLPMESKYSGSTGRDPVIMDSYLVFTYGNGISKLVGDLAESFTPRTPNAFTGEFRALCSVPGALFAARSGGSLRETNTSYYNADVGHTAIMVYRGGVWHPIASPGYRTGAESLHYQHLDTGVDLLWFASKSMIYYMFVPREWDYTRDPIFRELSASMPYLNESGALVTGLFDAGNLRVKKWWEDIFVSGDVPAAQKVMVYTQNEDSDLEPNLAGDPTVYTYEGDITPAAEGTEAVDTVNIRSGSRKLRLMFLLWGDGTNTPEINGYNLKYFGRIPEGKIFTVPFVLGDNQHDLTGKKESASAAARLEILSGWDSDVTKILTMRSIWAPDDNIRVVIEPGGLSPLEVISDANSGREKYLTSLTLRKLD